jgi:hypothetical protein
MNMLAVLEHLRLHENVKVRPGAMPPEAGTADGQLGTGAARGSLLMRLARH